ncbi:MAG: CNNM domain-containing protein [Candidatus Krumholzibacteriia bacterium]
MTPTAPFPGWDVLSAVTVACLLACAFFAGSETGLMSISRVRLRQLARRGPVAHLPRLERLLGRVEEPILTFLIGNNLATVFLGAVLTAAFGGRWGGRGEWLAGAVTALLVITLGEIVPKIVFREYPERLTLAVTPAIRGAMIVLAPARVVLRAWVALWSRLLPGGSASGASVLSREAVAALLLGHPELGVEDERFGAVLRRFLALGGRRLDEIMVPLSRVVAVPAGTGLAGAVAIAARSGYSRLPVADPAGGMAGWILARDLLLEAPRGAAADAAIPPVLRRDCLFVDAGLSPYELFEEMQWQHQQMAIVTDRDGRVLGLITLENLAEAIVGRIADEFDEPVAGGAAADAGAATDGSAAGG